VSDEKLLRGLKGLVASGAQVDASVVAHLAEVEERRLHLEAATSSLFDYCLRCLGFSEGEAFLRITAARLAKRFPVIFGLLAARTIHLSALRVLRDHLTRENHQALLAAASGKSKKEVEVLIAALAPRPDVVSSIRKLPQPRGTQLSRRTTCEGSSSPSATAAGDAQVGNALVGNALVGNALVGSPSGDDALAIPLATEASKPLAVDLDRSSSPCSTFVPVGSGECGGRATRAHSAVKTQSSKTGWTTLGI
jgi:hypothetical protein